MPVRPAEVLLDEIDTLEGLITPEIGRVLYGLAREVPDGQMIVEIGSYKGKSTCYLAAGARDGWGSLIYAVDTWEMRDHREWCRWCAPATLVQFHQQVIPTGLGEQIVAHQGFSTEVAEQWAGPGIGLLFIDGDHEAAAVRADFDAWAPHMARGGTIVFDDYDTPGNPGVHEALDGGIRKRLAGPVDVVAQRLAIGRVR